MRKIMCIVFAAVLAFASITSSFAEETLVATTSGRCKKAYNTTSTLDNGGSGWDSFCFEPYYGITYTDTGNYGSPTLYDENSISRVYGYARPVGLDGTLYGTRFPIYCPHTTNWTANSSGRNAQTARFKVHNVLSVDHNFHTSTMTVPTSCFWGIKKTS